MHNSRHLLFLPNLPRQTSAQFYEGYVSYAYGGYAWYSVFKNWLFRNITFPRFEIVFLIS